MLGIPRDSHRYFIEPLSDTQHIMFSLFKRFVKFVDNIASSKKLVLRNMLSIVKYDCRSNTGHNLRKMMLLVNKTSVDDLTKDDFKNQIYNEVPHGDEWKVGLAKEIIEVVNGNMDIETFNDAEINEIFHYILT